MTATMPLKALETLERNSVAVASRSNGNKLAPPDPAVLFGYPEDSVGRCT